MTEPHGRPQEELIEFNAGGTISELTWKTADPKAGGIRTIRCPLGDDESAGTRDVGVSRNRLVGHEVYIALDAEPEFAVHGGELTNTYLAEFGMTVPWVAEAEGAIAIGGIDFGE
jgi:hypothetical protein